MKVSLKNKIISAKKNKKQHVLLLFLIVSTFFWFLTKLSKEYRSVVLYNVEYKNLPNAKLFQNDPPKTLELYIKSTGFKLLSEKFNTKTIVINLKKVVFKEKYHYYILSKNIEARLQTQLPQNIHIESVVKDTLFYELGVNKFKKVPVVSNIDIGYKLGYNLSGEIKINPDSIEVRGPEAQIDKIKELYLEPLVLEDVSENVYHVIPLNLPEASNKVVFSNKEVNVIAVVEKFTEDSFEVPFEVVGLPKGANITTYPKTVQVVFQVGLSSYSKISPSNFKVHCNYKYSEANNYEYLIPEVVMKPDLISSVKIIPNQIEYLIQKK
jgi:hypothetical protein